MPFSKVFNIKDNCKDNECKVNKKNIKTIFKPDDGFIDKALERELFANSYKICDCIIICKDEKIIIHEILCGKLTYSEFKEKSQQLHNCLKVVEELGLIEKVKQVSLQYKKLEDSKKNPQLKKKLTVAKIGKFALNTSSEITSKIGC